MFRMTEFAINPSKNASPRTCYTKKLKYYFCYVRPPSIRLDTYNNKNYAIGNLQIIFIVFFINVIYYYHGHVNNLDSK